MYIVYILQSQSTRRYYVGSTKNLPERLRRHNSNRNVSTRHRGPWVAVYKEIFPDRQSAWTRERQIKRMKGGNGFKRLLKERRPKSNIHTQDFGKVRESLSQSGEVAERLKAAGC